MPEGRPTGGPSTIWGPIRWARNVYAVPLAGGVPRVVVRFDDPTRPWHRYGFGGYGDRFYFTVGDRESDVWVANVGAAPP